MSNSTYARLIPYGFYPTFDTLYWKTYIFSAQFCVPKCNFMIKYAYTDFCIGTLYILDLIFFRVYQIWLQSIETIRCTNRCINWCNRLNYQTRNRTCHYANQFFNASLAQFSQFVTSYRCFIKNNIIIRKSENWNGARNHITLVSYCKFLHGGLFDIFRALNKKMEKRTTYHYMCKNLCTTNQPFKCSFIKNETKPYEYTAKRNLQ